MGGQDKKWMSLKHRIMESNNMRYRKTTTEKLGRGMERSKEGVTFLFVLRFRK